MIRISNVIFGFKLTEKTFEKLSNVFVHFYTTTTTKDGVLIRKSKNQLKKQ